MPSDDDGAASDPGGGRGGPSLPEPAELWLPLSRWARLGAFAFDLLVLSFVVMIVQGLGRAAMVLGRVPAPYDGLAAEMLMTVVVLAYSASEIGDGQTPGKGQAGVTVCVLIDGPAERRRTIRWAWRAAPVLLILAALVVETIVDLVARHPTTAVAGQWATLAMVAALVLAVAGSQVSFGPLRQSWYDLLAGTAVMRRGVPPARRGFEPIFPGGG